MGTTQRIKPGVPGQPNWKDLSRAITHIAKTVEKENSDEENEKTQEQLAKEYIAIIQKRKRNIKATFNNLVKIGGGKKNIVQGKSSSIGKAGLRSTHKLVSFFSGVNTVGLPNTLIQYGFGQLEGKTIQDVLDFMLVYCTDSNAGMDETAANKATCEVLNEIIAKSDNNLEKFESIIKDYVESNGLSDLICSFWGHYIFEHLSQLFNEKITQIRGEIVSKETFKLIKDDIMGQVKVLNEIRPITRIDWQGQEGIIIIESIFESILNIICDDDIS